MLNFKTILEQAQNKYAQYIVAFVRGTYMHKKMSQEVIIMGATIVDAVNEELKKLKEEK